jgi:capsular polysaccharide biosynthesis protein
LVWFKDELPKDYPILMEHGVHNNIISLLNLFDFNNIIFIHPNIEIRVKNLITFSKSAIIVDSLTKDLNSCEINSELMLNLRDKIFNLTNFSNAKNLQKDLFIFRRKSMSRSLIFKQNTLKLIRKSGFEFVFIENFSLQDQINLCSKVDVLIMEGGASLTNFLFINSQCKILYFTNEMLGDYKLPEYFCSIFGLNLQIITGRLKFLSVWRASTLYDLFHSNYSLSYSRMKKVLNELDVN